VKAHKPFRVVLEQPKIDTMIDDVIHGYVHTGSNACAKTFFDKLELEAEAIEEQITEKKEPDYIGFRLLTHVYHHSVAADLINDRNAFTLVLLGEKNHYVVHLGLDDFRIVPRQHGSVLAIGSGNTVANARYRVHGDPVMALLETFLEEVTCGGLIDQWYFGPLVEGGPVVLERRGFYEPPRTHVEIRRVIQEHLVLNKQVELTYKSDKSYPAIPPRQKNLTKGEAMQKAAVPSKKSSGGRAAAQKAAVTRRKTASRKTTTPR
jgi:hypothetical protein